MFKKFKRRLYKTILNKKLKLVFLFLFALGFLFNAGPTQALFGVGDFGIFDVAGLQLDALDFIDSSVLQYMVFIFILLAESTIFTALSASLLQWAINLPINLTNQVVTQGWNFIAGISNALLLLVLVFIALAYILKIETFEAKKVLPKLILIALLINFSKVFVGAFVDIAQILQNTISGALSGENGNLNFITDAMETLVESSGDVLLWLGGIIIGYSLVALIPYGSTISLIILLGLFITGPLLQLLVKAIVLIIFNFVSGIIFLSFTGLFLIRISMIWILTIFAPLAFVASILKTTKKHWDNWLKMLVEWSFLGVVVLFLLGLGIKFLGVIIDEPLSFSKGAFKFPEFISYYLFLLVYLGVVLILSKQNMPKFAEDLIGQAKTLAKGGVKLVPQKIKDRVTEAIIKTDEWVQGRPKVIQAFAKPFTGPASKAAFQSRARRREEVKIPTGLNLKDKARYIQSQTTAQKRVTLAAKMGVDLAKTKPEFKQEIMKDVQKMTGDKTYSEDIKTIMENIPDMMDKKVAIDLEETEEGKTKLRKKINDKAIEIRNSLTSTEIEVEIKAKYKLKENEAITDSHKERWEAGLKDTAAAAISISKAKPISIEKINNPKSLAVRVGSHGWSSKVWQKFTESFGAEAINDIVEGPGGINSIVKDGPSFEKFCREHPRTAQFLLFNRGGQELGWNGAQIARDQKITRPKLKEMVKILSELEKPGNEDMKSYYELCKKIRKAEQKLEKELERPDEEREAYEAEIEALRASIEETKEEVMKISETLPEEKRTIAERIENLIK